MGGKGGYGPIPRASEQARRVHGSLTGNMAGLVHEDAAQRSAALSQDWRGAIGSMRVVLTRAGSGGRIERHSNSTQYLFALDGSVETHVHSTDGLRVDRYGQGGSVDLEDRWHVVPPGTWHRSIARDAVVAFHSARQVIDEYQ